MHTLHFYCSNIIILYRTVHGQYYCKKMLTAHIVVKKKKPHRTARTAIFFAMFCNLHLSEWVFWSVCEAVRSGEENVFELKIFSLIKTANLLGTGNLLERERVLGTSSIYKLWEREIWKYYWSCVKFSWKFCEIF